MQKNSSNFKTFALVHFIDACPLHLGCSLEYKKGRRGEAAACRKWRERFTSTDDYDGGDDLAGLVIDFGFWITVCVVSRLVGLICSSFSPLIWSWSWQIAFTALKPTMHARTQASVHMQLHFCSQTFRLSCTFRLTALHYMVFFNYLVVVWETWCIFAEILINVILLENLFEE